MTSRPPPAGLPVATTNDHQWNFGTTGTIQFPEAGRQLLTFHCGKDNNFACVTFQQIDPVSLTIDEGKQVIRAVRENKIVFQTGTQQRSGRRFRLACELVRNGRIGKLQTVEVFVPAGLREGPFATGQAVPAGLNWDLWLGQAPHVGYMKERAGNSFRWWWDYAGGPVTDWGAHHNDIARWAIGHDGPIAVEAEATVGPIAGGYTTCKEFEPHQPVEPRFASGRC